jgi:hypothetical protein
VINRGNYRADIFKTALVKDHHLAASARAWEDSGARESI